MAHAFARRFPIGAEIHEDRVSLRVWAPGAKSVSAVVEDDVAAGSDCEKTHVALKAEGDGYFSALSSVLRAGSRYRYRLDDDPALYPDPASRFQPEGPHGPFPPGTQYDANGPWGKLDPWINGSGTGNPVAGGTVGGGGQSSGQAATE